METIWIIEDWAGNVLDWEGRFGCRPLAEMEFKDFEDGWGYIRERWTNEEDWEDFYVVKKGE